MVKLKVVFFVVMLVTGMNSLTAQVEFSVDTDQPLASYGSFRRFTEDERTIVEFLYLTKKGEYCTGNFGEDRYSEEAEICVFDDPTKADTRHLYVTTGGYNLSFVVYYNGNVVHVLEDEQGLGALQPGKYMIQVILFHRNGNFTLYSTVTFSIGEVSSLVDAADEIEIVESIQLDTPALGTNWDRSDKRTMKSGCIVAYARPKSEVSAVAIVLLGDTAIEEVTVYNVYDSNMSPLGPPDADEVDSGGFRTVISLYLNPQDQEEYTLQYERAGQVFEVAFEYEAGSTESGKFASSIVIEC